MPFRIGLTADFLNENGELGWGDIGLAELDGHPNIEWGFMPDYGSIIPPEAADEWDAFLVLSPSVTAATVSEAKRLRIVARFGVGYDNVDVDACTRAGVAVTISPDGVRRPVAVAAVALILAATHNIVVKDGLTRQGLWHQKLDHMGIGVTGRMLGIIGFGNIGQEIVRASRSLGMSYQAHDPYAAAGPAEQLGVPLVGLEQLLRSSDIVCITAQLTAETRHLISRERLELMKRDAFLVNVGRGPIVDEEALIDVLERGAIRGAALDVFEQEPPARDNPLFGYENVILTPHAVAYTDELAIGNGRSALRSILDFASGRRPAQILNPEVVTVREPTSLDLGSERRSDR